MTSDRHRPRPTPIQLGDGGTRYVPLPPDATLRKVAAARRRGARRVEIRIRPQRARRQRRRRGSPASERTER